MSEEMTDKQIIIDGVDVSGCDFLAKEDDYCSYSGETRAYKGQCGCSDEEMCKDHPNCFYKKALKQLKRKEQECEKAKQNAQDTYDLWQALIESFNILQGEKIKLEQECEGLGQAYLETNELLQEKTKECTNLKADNEELKNAYARLNSLYNDNCNFTGKLEQTLAEIKEICNKTVCDYLQCSLNYNHSKDFECEKTSCDRAKRRKFILEILQKINEVGNELTL